MTTLFPWLFKVRHERTGRPDNQAAMPNRPVLSPDNPFPGRPMRQIEKRTLSRARAEVAKFIRVASYRQNDA